MDLRHEIDKIINEYGHYVLLQRTSRKIRCSCWNEKFQEALQGCPYCLGKGWVSRIERHRVRRQTATNIITLPNRTLQASIGQLSTDTRVFFMRHDVAPKTGDVIYEVGWINGKPTHVVTAFEINYPDDMRGDGGRVEFYQVAAKEITNPLNIKDIKVRRLGPTINYELRKEKVT